MATHVTIVNYGFIWILLLVTKCEQSYAVISMIYYFIIILLLLMFLNFVVVVVSSSFDATDCKMSIVISSMKLEQGKIITHSMNTLKRKHYSVVLYCTTCTMIHVTVQFGHC